MASKVPVTIDKFESLSGQALVLHFKRMDELLWDALSLIAQDDPVYLQQCSLLPIIRQVTGTSHGRRWFTHSYVQDPMLRLLEIVRLWSQQAIDWYEFLIHLYNLNFYRDTLRSWVEDARPQSERVHSHVSRYLTAYFAFRHEVTNAYLPLVWRVASSHGFSEESRQDLFQIGTTGLIHAAERYNNDGPVTFSTFASRWVRQAILMYVSRKMPLIQVSHSVLEEESKIARAERESGEEDHSPRAQRIRRLSATKDVLLTDEVEAEEETEQEPVVDLNRLPQLMKKIVIFRHGLLERASCSASPDELEQERQRQFRALAETL